MQLMESITSHPVTPQFVADDLEQFLMAVMECGHVCVSCADACLAQEARLVRCIRTSLDCADICMVTQRVVTRQSAPDMKVIQSQVQTLAMACLSCRDECLRHAERLPACRLCADACARCEETCQRLLSFFPLTVSQDSR